MGRDIKISSVIRGNKEHKSTVGGRVEIGQDTNGGQRPPRAELSIFNSNSIFPPRKPNIEPKQAKANQMAR